MIRRKRKPTPGTPQAGTPQWPTQSSVMAELIAALEHLYPPQQEASDE
jgi:hypothetical protein